MPSWVDIRHTAFVTGRWAHLLALVLVVGLECIPAGFSLNSFVAQQDEMLHVFGPAEQGPEGWVSRPDFDPKTEPYDSLRGHYVHFPHSLRVPDDADGMASWAMEGQISFGQPAAFNFGADDFSITLWCAADNGAYYGPVLLGRRGSGEGGGPGFEIRYARLASTGEPVVTLDPPPEREWSYWGQSVLEFVAYTASGYVVPVGNRVSDDKSTELPWTFFAVTRAGEQLSVYLNGVLVHQAVLPKDAVLDGSGDLMLGSSNFRVDDLALWQRALAAEEVAALVREPLVGTEPGLLSYWDFEDGGGGVVRDRSPRRHDGKVVLHESRGEWVVAQVRSRFLKALVLALLLAALSYPYFRGQRWAQLGLLLVYAPLCYTVLMTWLYVALALDGAHIAVAVELSKFTAITVGLFGLYACLLVGKRRV